ncbi:MAG: hypothetical protein ACYDBH_18035 [Acidobacteriaceae bacterium]
MTIAFNPALMTAPQNSFLLETQRFIQGLTQDDPISRMHLMAAQVVSTVAQPVWGGMGVTLLTGSLGNNNPMLTSAGLATTTSIQGFTVYDQGINYIQVPGSSAPTVVGGQDVPVYAFGSKARVPLPLASGVLTSLEDVSIFTSPLYWDTVAFNVTLTSSANTVALPAGVGVLAVNDTSRTISYDSTTQAVTWLEGQAAGLFVL